MDDDRLNVNSGALERVGSKRGAATHALGRSRGGLTTKLHVAVDALGNPVRFVVSPGQHADIRYGPVLIDGMPAEVVIADRGYDSAAFVEHIAAAGAVAVIPSRRTNRHQRAFDANLYADRNKVERLIGRMKQFRRVATRYDKTATSFRAFVHVAACFVLLA